MRDQSPFDVRQIVVRPVLASELARFGDELDEHHWLGHRLVGETMRYVAVSGDGEWLSLVGFGAAALACRPRDQFVGWSDEAHFRRLRYVTNNQRFCVDPPVLHLPSYSNRWLSAARRGISGICAPCRKRPLPKKCRCAAWHPPPSPSSDA